MMTLHFLSHLAMEISLDLNASTFDRINDAFCHSGKRQSSGELIENRPRSEQSVPRAYDI